MKSLTAGNASATIENDRDNPRPQGASAPAGTKQAPPFQRSGRALVSRVRRPAAGGPANTLASELARIADDGYRALALAELDIMVEFLAALDHAKRTAKGPQLAAIIALLRATRDSKTAAARAAEMSRIKAGQGTKSRGCADARITRKTANGGPR